MKRSFGDVERRDTSLFFRSFYAGIEFDAANIPRFLESIEANIICPDSLKEEIKQLKGSNPDQNDIEIGGVNFINLFAVWKSEVSARNFEYSKFLEKLLNTSFLSEPDIYQIVIGMKHHTISRAFLNMSRNPSNEHIQGAIDSLIGAKCSSKSFHILFSILPHSPCLSQDSFFKLAKMEIALEPETLKLVFDRINFIMTTGQINDILQAMGQLNFIVKALSLVRPDKFTLYYAVFQGRPAELVFSILEYVNQTAAYIVLASMSRQYDESLVRCLVQKCPNNLNDAMVEYALSKGYSREFINSLAE